VKIRVFLRSLTNNINDLIAQTFGQGGLLGPLRGPSTLAWLTRIWALVWITIQFSNYFFTYEESVQVLVRTILLTFYFYVIISLFGEIYLPKLFFSDWARTLRICFEIIVYSFFYFVSDDYRSEIYLLYLPALIVAIRYLDSGKALFGLTLTLICFHWVFTHLIRDQWTFEVLQSYIVRLFVLIGMGIFYSIYRYRTIITDVQKERSSLLNAFKAFNKGMYVIDQQMRLLFVNDTLMTKHGPYFVGQPCGSYFGCPESLCDFHPVDGEIIREEEVLQNFGSFLDQDGHPYKVEVFKSPLKSENGELVGIISFVNNLDDEEGAEIKLREYTRLVERRVEALTMERDKILSTVSDLGIQLTRPVAPQDIMKFVAEVAKDRLNAETAALFLLEDDRLVRKGISGLPDEWFSEENYPAGVGITWQVMIVRKGEKYGGPVRLSDVDNDPSVVQRHLLKYREKLQTRQVKHLLAVPINGWERTFGVLRVVNKLDEKGGLFQYGFSQEDENFLTSLASMASISIENQHAILLREATRRLQDIRTLLTVSEHITAARSLKELLQVIVKEACEAIPSAEKAIIHLIDYQHESLTLKATSGKSNNHQIYPP